MSKHGRENFWSCAKELNLIVILNFFPFFLVVVQQNCTVRKKKKQNEDIEKPYIQTIPNKVK